MKKIKINKDILEVNNKQAEANKKLFDKHHVFVLNIMGTPGCGKTTLLEKIIPFIQNNLRCGVIEGDLATDKDAERLKQLNIPVVQINTDQIGNACHLSSQMIYQVLPKLDLDKLDLLFIENIGNLVCPAEYLLGEHKRISMISIAEGDDKVSKYPPMFIQTDCIIINKMDLLPHVEYNLTFVHDEIKRLNPNAPVFEISLKDGSGVETLINKFILNYPFFG